MSVLAPWSLVALCAWTALVAGSPTPVVPAVRLDDAVTSPPKSQGGPQNRLPLTVFPKSYVVDLDVDLEAGDTGTFSGTVTVTLQPVKEVAFLTFNVDLDVITITSASLKQTGKGGGITFPTQDQAVIEQDKGLQMVTLRWNEAITGSDIPMSPAETYELKVVYTGKLRSDMYGFYRSSYKNAQQDIRMAATQFEPAYARSAFPCWDEPHYKATFQVSITHATSLTALSNTAGTRADIAGNTARTKTTFQVTPLMSSYLVAFVVSNFVGVAGVSPTTATTTAAPSGATTQATPGAVTARPTIPYTIWVRPGQQNQAAFAATVGPKSLAELEKFTGIRYDSMQLGKLDLIGIPDFAAGAMENWGLITFRETGILFTDGETTEASRESIALVIAHEQTHMWFGDLVSPDWWGFVWLNEGFARYMQYVSMDLVEPQWRLMDTFTVRSLQGALAFDALKSSHPMSATVYTPDAIQSIFDRISYDKGASVLHMTRNVMGDTKFKAALNDYLSKKRNDAAIPYDLFSAFDRSLGSDSGLPRGLTMAVALEAWTQEAGYPVVTLRTENGKTTVSQERFLSSQGECVSTNTRWWVPLTYTVQSGDFNAPKTVWLDPRVANTTLADQVTGWVVANIKQTGFYRVNYDDANWARLAALLQTENNQVPILNRAQMLDDALSLARAGLLKYPVALNMTRYLRTETDPIPWTAALGHLDFLNKMLAGDAGQTAFNNYVLGLMDAAYKSVGFAEDASDNHLKLTFRPTVLGQACRLGLKDCVDSAKTAFTSVLGGTAIPASQRSTVYCMGVRYGTTADWDTLWNRYLSTTTTVGERSLILGALGCSNDANTIDKYLGYSLDANMVRAQDASTVFSSVLSGGDANLDPAFDYFIANFDKMNTAYGGWSSMQNVVNGLASRIVDETRLKKLEDFLSSKSSALGVAQAAAEQALETARANLAWRRQHLQAVSGWVLSGALSALHPAPLILALALAFLLLRS
ncbi:aminopeptidase N-like [Thrips palmi]|uniref:Aminopeptidase n=1 Tax=Thrips palmi TaxID=161013 RepID=A0A6P8ZIP5_THRPL|nr:aminopeptidase N-like [Thrips palmi]